ncbi:MAG: hypothetical protein QCI82_02705 [Candidatus Thermoplasmatota archaeon]|nr:hypothetical protein [Candidatus Thermoplasmatota archaeon]
MRASKESTKIRKIGNGRGILLSRSICNLMGVDIDDHFIIDIEEDRLILLPGKMNEGDECG